MWEVWGGWGDTESRRGNCSLIFLCLSAFSPNMHGHEELKT
ncbi:hypothetical protein [Okeania sp. SIO3I5]|nr:hypothetical protein [Okeania sp. SIO3I5]